MGLGAMDDCQRLCARGHPAVLQRNVKAAMVGLWLNVVRSPCLQPSQNEADFELQLGGAVLATRTQFKDVCWVLPFLASTGERFLELHNSTLDARLYAYKKHHCFETPMVRTPSCIPNVGQLMVLFTFIESSTSVGLSPKTSLLLLLHSLPVSRTDRNSVSNSVSFLPAAAPPACLGVRLGHAVAAIDWGAVFTDSQPYLKYLR
jgi:hypothetical protein